MEWRFGLFLQFIMILNLGSQNIQNSIYNRVYTMRAEKISKLPVIHFSADTQKELTTAFVRVSEFYESPYGEIHGKYFDLKEYKKLYAKDHEGRFTYYSDWTGFNIPSSSFKKFCELFSDSFTKKEQYVFNEVEKIIGDVFTRKKYYLIGTYKGPSQRSTFEHEIAHSLYSLKRNYKKVCDETYKKIPEKTIEKIVLALKGLGYDEESLRDEIQAYSSTDSLAIFKDRFSLDFNEIPIEAIYDYQNNFYKFHKLE